MPKSIKKKVLKPSRDPQNVSDTVWYYEYKRYIEVVYQVWVGGKLLRTDTFKIPKKMLTKTLKRMK